jgi:ABC-type Fe3+/spermidine/putrescine transport system ATPase subunit
MRLEIHNLTRTYADMRALDNLCLEVSAGALAVIGPSGSGKTTLCAFWPVSKRPTAVPWSKRA